MQVDETIAGVFFAALFIGALITAGLLIKRDRGTHADEMPKMPQKDDVEAESKRNAR